jgi:hypothetical protein
MLKRWSSEGQAHHDSIHAAARVVEIGFLGSYSVYSLASITRPASPCSRGWADDSHILRGCWPSDVHSLAFPDCRLSVIGRYVHDLTAAIGVADTAVSFGG